MSKEVIEWFKNRGNAGKQPVVWGAQRSEGDAWNCRACFAKGRVTKILVPETSYHAGVSLQTDYKYVRLCDECAQALKNALGHAEEPIALDKLKEMAGSGEPVWVVSFEEPEEYKPFWHVLRSDDVIAYPQNDEKPLLIFRMKESEYGKRWIAFRSKQEPEKIRWIINEREGL
jgi:hypothetical protein